MQAPSNLSSEQKHTLKLTTTCLEGVSAYLESSKASLPPFEKLQVENLIAMAELCKGKLLQFLGGVS
jgi:hypothetical protein